MQASEERACVRVACEETSKTMNLLWNVLGYNFRMVDATIIHDRHYLG